MSRTPPDLAALRPRRVCLIKPSALGDVVNATPVLVALRSRWPDASFAWVINRELRGLVEGLPGLDEVIPFDRRRAGFGPFGLAAFARFLLGLRRRRFDLTIDLQGLLRSGLMARATGASVRVGRADAREGAGRFYTHRVPMPPEPAHAVAKLLRVAAAFGAEVESPRFLAAMTDADRQWAASLLAGLPRPILAVNVGARWETKRWPPAHFAAVARHAVEARGAGIVAVGAPEDAPLAADFRAALGPIPVLDLCGRTSLPQLAALLGACDAVLSNDTGPLHLAVAAGARVVGIYTCTSPEENGPYGPRAIAVRTKVACAASYVTRCNRLDCMTELNPERVIPAILTQLDAAMRAGSSAA